MLQTLLDRFARRDRLALSRLVSMLARGESIEEILTGIGPPVRSTPARVVALTGAGGVGKSTLTGKLIQEIRSGRTASGSDTRPSVAVLACDPESPLSGGALLGDRFRMPSLPDEGVFIRSLAASGGQGAVARHLEAIIRLLEAFGFDVILVETVGAGQGDTAVRALVDVVVLLLQPETGDDLQWEKAGLLEVADLIVIHKADMPGAERAEAQVIAAMGLSLSSGSRPAVLRVSSRSGAGVAELWQVIAARPPRRGLHRDANELFRLLRERLQARFAATAQEYADLVERWQRGAISTDEAQTELGQALLGRP